MNETWMKAGESGIAHLIRLSGSYYFVAACEVAISRNFAVRVPVHRFGLAGAPGRHYYKPFEGDICPECERRAKQQA